MGILLRLIISGVLAHFLSPFALRLLDPEFVKSLNGMESWAMPVIIGILCFLLLSGRSSSGSNSRASVQVLPAANKELDLAGLQSLMQSGKMIDAIKLIRQSGSLGLKEAKDIAERFKASGFSSVSIQTAGFKVNDQGVLEPLNASAPSVEERLVKLNDLKEKGLITLEEYQDSRKELLKEITSG